MIDTAAVAGGMRSRSQSGMMMELDQVGGEASSALLMLSQMANSKESQSSQHQQQGQQQNIQAPTAACPQKQPIRKHVLNVMALVQHITSLEDRVRHLESIVIGHRCSKSELPTPTGLGSGPMCVSAPTTTATSPKNGPVPSSLTSIKFTVPESARSLLSPASDAPSATSPSLTHPSSRYQQQHASSMPSPPSQNIWPGQHPHHQMVMKDATVKDVQRNILDRICQPLLETCYDPDKTRLMDVVDELEKHHFYHIDRRVLMSAVRRWFRKRREEMGSRVFMLCKTSELHSVDSAGIREFLRGLKENVELLDRFRSRAGIEIKDISAAREFCYEKIDSFYRRKMVQLSP